MTHIRLVKAAFRYSLSVLKIYTVRNVYYRFSVLAVNIGTQPKRHYSVSCLYFSSNTSFHKRRYSAFFIERKMLYRKENPKISINHCSS